MSAIAAPQATPSRLLCRRGRWLLELTRLERVERNVFQPRRERLEGSEAILTFLRRVPDLAALAHSALSVMRGTRADEDREFEVVDGEFAPSCGADERKRAPDVELEAAFAELRSELLVLRASHQKLRARVAQLEAELERIPRKERAPAGRPAAAVAPVPAPAARIVEPQPFAPNGTLASAGAPAIEPYSSPEPAAEPPPAAHPFKEVVAALGAEDKPPASPIGLPGASEVIAALAELFGGDAGFTEDQEPLPETALELAALYACRLVNEDGEDVGCVLAELKVTAHLGGKLMGLPGTLIDEQARSGVLSEDTFSAMTEVCNTLSSAISRVAGNGPVRSTSVEPFAADRLRWIQSARQRLGLGKARVGNAWLLAR